MNEVEFAKYQADKEAEIQHQAEAATRAVARQAILDRLGLTEDEAKILLG
jgi:hypothetical protein